MNRATTPIPITTRGLLVWAVGLLAATALTIAVIALSVDRPDIGSRGPAAPTRMSAATAAMAQAPTAEDLRVTESGALRAAVAVPARGDNGGIPLVGWFFIALPLGALLVGLATMYGGRRHTGQPDFGSWSNPRLRSEPGPSSLWNRLGRLLGHRY